MKQGNDKFVIAGLTHSVIEDELRQYGLQLDNPAVVAVTTEEEATAAIVLPSNTPWCVVEAARFEVVNKLGARFGFNQKIPDVIRLLNDEVVPRAYRPKKGP